MNKLVLVFFAGSIMVACTPKTAEVIEVMEVEKNVEVNEDQALNEHIAEGSKLYSANCGKCHKLFDASEFSKDQWETIVPTMAKKAKLDAVAENKVLQYVLSETGK